MAPKNDITTTIRIPKEMMEAVKSAANKEGMPVSVWIRVSLLAAIKEGRAK